MYEAAHPPPEQRPLITAVKNLKERLSFYSKADDLVARVEQYFLRNHVIFKKANPKVMITYEDIDVDKIHAFMNQAMEQGGISIERLLEVSGNWMDSVVQINEDRAQKSPEKLKEIWPEDFIPKEHEVPSEWKLIVERPTYFHLVLSTLAC